VVRPGSAKPSSPSSNLGGTSKNKSSCDQAAAFVFGHLSGIGSYYLNRAIFLKNEGSMDKKKKKEPGMKMNVKDGGIVGKTVCGVIT
jgi:hypothetical protein